jgi:hypothetical protein
MAPAPALAKVAAPCGSGSATLGERYEKGKVEKNEGNMEENEGKETRFGTVPEPYLRKKDGKFFLYKYMVYFSV